MNVHFRDTANIIALILALIHLVIYLATYLTSLIIKPIFFLTLTPHSLNGSGKYFNKVQIINIVGF